MLWKGVIDMQKIPPELLRGIVDKIEEYFDTIKDYHPDEQRRTITLLDDLLRAMANYENDRIQEIIQQVRAEMEEEDGINRPLSFYCSDTTSQSNTSSVESSQSESHVQSIAILFAILINNCLRC